MTQPLYTIVVSSAAWPNAGSQAERALNKGYMPDAFLTSTGGETANISPLSANSFTSTGDVTALYVVGRRARIVHGSASTATSYCEVLSSVLTGASTATTVTVGNFTLGATALSTVAISEVALSPVWWSTGSGNLRASTGSPAAPSVPIGPYGNLGLYASSSSIVGFSVAGATVATIGAGYFSVGTNPASAGGLRLPNGTPGAYYARNGANTDDVVIAYVDALDNVNIGNGLFPVHLDPSDGNLDIRYPVTALGGGAAATLGVVSTGSTGPVTTTQHSWLKILVNGTVSYIPLWR